MPGEKGASSRLVQPHIQALQLAHVGQVLAHQVRQLLPFFLPTLPAIMAGIMADISALCNYIQNISFSQSVMLHLLQSFAAVFPCIRTDDRSSAHVVDQHNNLDLAYYNYSSFTKTHNCCLTRKHALKMAERRPSKWHYMARPSTLGEHLSFGEPWCCMRTQSLFISVKLSSRNSSASLMCPPSPSYSDPVSGSSPRDTCRAHQLSQPCFLIAILKYEAGMQSAHTVTPSAQIHSA